MTMSRLSSSRLGPFNAGIGWDVLSTSTGNSNISITWPAMPGAAGYQVLLGSTTPINVGNVLTHNITGLTPTQVYSVTVVGYNSAGLFSGVASPKSVTVTQYNVASGGTETTISNYNGTGETWKVHTFTSAGTFSVTSASTTFRVLVVGGGGGGGGSNGSNNGQQPGQGGYPTEFAARSISAGSYPVTIGSGGGGSFLNDPGGSGTASTFHGITANGGIGGLGQTYGGWTPPAPSSVTTNITGTSITYGATPGPQTQNRGNGGAAGLAGQAGSAQGGMNGVVIISYRIA